MTSLVLPSASSVKVVIEGSNEYRMKDLIELGFGRDVPVGGIGIVTGLSYAIVFVLHMVPIEISLNPCLKVS